MQLDIKITEQDLPVLSAIATKALKLLQDPNVTNRRIEELIRQDPALTERVLRTSNAPFYGARRQSTSIGESLVRLGLRQLQSVIVVAATGELFNAKDPIVQRFWNHAIASALAAHELATRLRAAQAEESFIAGMLHNVGEQIIYRQHPEIYGQLLADADAAGRPRHEIEVERFQYFTHMSVGALVIRKWTLTDAVAEASRFHHDLERSLPDELPMQQQMQSPTMSCIVSLASVFVCHLGIAPPLVPWEEIPQLACARYLQMTARQLDDLKTSLETSFTSQRANFG